MELKDILTLLVAAYAALLSTYVAVVQRQDKAPRVKVRTSYGFLTAGPQISDTHILMEAANIGEKPVTLSSVGLLLPDGSQFINSSNNSTHRLPCELTHGKNLTMWFDVKPLAVQLKQRGYSSVIKLSGRFSD
ncbi:MAG: hypothetical protein M5U24_09570 [Candidatus Kuenenia sp.]|uniref:Uncharacterized protein n=1 Tax=Kuenenia stuttgartiensis TaxID=174633 RepID=A0A2C9CKN3_KUEST|nr:MULTISPECIES: hypothetical protein [Kuenenia]MCZ7622717.1 hypothetical protein [Candidatus Kuenenia sp.]SOH05347.1 hypothetical protein KSMBR1_2866 [Candidatus Kuenenia stuttgartiensis]